MDFGSPFFAALKDSCPTVWQDYVDHEFVRKLGDGSLPEACFKHYLVQDYLFLLHYSRAYALAVVKSEHLDDLRDNAAAVNLLLNHEIALHVEFCAQWGLSEADMAAVPEADPNRLYTRYVLDQGNSGDLLDLLVALLPCSLGYAEIGARLAASPQTRLEGNPYRAWIEMYSGEEFQNGAYSAAVQLERVAKRRGIEGDPTKSARWSSLAKNFQTASQLEVGFWGMGMNP
ncbi:thiaminase II [Rhodovibrionaceae bacterium A322]